eukprot:2695635-Amphidinium_carterae.1
MLWLDHSISSWATTATQWHLNEYTAITMLNTRSMSQAFRNWCENNWLNVVLNKYLEADGSIKPQYATTDNGVEHDHKVAMPLRKWHNDNFLVLNNQHVTMQISNADNGTDLQWSSPVTILHSSITMTVEGDSK